MLRPLILSVTFFLLAWSGLGSATELGSPASVTRPKIGLVLSGGGARGVAHVGVLKELERLHVPVDYIAGTSMGSIIGGLYASGMSVDEIERELAAIDWGDILRDDPKRTELSYRRKRDDDDFLVRNSLGVREGEVRLPAGMLQGQKLLLLLKGLTQKVAHIQDFDDLPVPFRAVATDISTGKEVVMGSGDIALAMRASAAIPSVFAPVHWDGKLLVDGGLANNTPVAVAKSMGADVVIVVDISTPLYKQEELTNMLVIANQLTGFMTRSNTEESLRLLGPEDVLIVPDLGDISTTSFTESMQAIEPGRKAAEQQSAKLERLALASAGRVGNGAGHSSEVSPAPAVEFVEINNRSSLSDEVIRARLTLPIGKPLDNDRLDADIQRIYGMNLFEQVSYDLVLRDGKQGVRINVYEKSWGPNYLQGGLSFQSQWDEEAGFTLGTSYTKTNINPLGGEWKSIINLGEQPRLFTELYQPLDPRGRWFINPGVDLTRKRIGLYADSEHLADYELSQTKLFIEGGRELSDWGEFRVGYQYAKGDFELSIGSPFFPDEKFASGMLFARLGVDTLDNRYFANQGDLANVQYSWYGQALGGDDDFDQIRMSWFGARTLERSSLLMKAVLGITPDDDAPVYGRYTLGGFFDLSAYSPNELSGQQKALFLVGGMYRLVDYEYLPVYLGGTLEAGNTWERLSQFGDAMRFSASLFLGSDTFLGPFYFGVAGSDDGHENLFMMLGSPF